MFNVQLPGVISVKFVRLFKFFLFGSLALLGFSLSIKMDSNQRVTFVERLKVFSNTNLTC